TEGSWIHSANISGYEGENYQHCNGEGGGLPFSWSISSAPGQYEVYAKWTSHSNRATDATYSVVHNEGIANINIDQSQSGGQWHLLGIYTLDSNSEVQLSCQSNGYAVADAIHLISVDSPAPQVIWSPNEIGLRNI